ncbi:hypothetical protein LguiA_012058 [Lonicera macranthoides]
MESNDNKLEAKSQSQPQSKPPRAEPHTRLQQQAPAALQLDAITDPNPALSSNAMAFSCSAIPLLSPLILSPQSQLEAAEERLTGVSEQPNNNNNNAGGGTEIMVGGGWVHPAVGTYAEAASMFDFFQSQCTMVHRVQ